VKYQVGRSPPDFLDDGAVHTVSYLWHPTYVAILLDGKPV